MAPVRVVTDSSCDLPPAVAEELGIEVVPLTIRFGGEEYVDRRDLTPQQFWAKVAASPVLPETAAPPPGAFEEAFRKAAAEGAEGIVCVNLSSKLSATIQSAQLAAKAVEGDLPVRVIDSLSITLAVGIIAVECARAARDGATVDEVAALAEERVPRVRVYGALDTLENLKKGGRIGAAQALLGSMLSIKPIIEVRQGEVHPESRQRTRGRALTYLLEKVREHGQVENLAVLHGDAPDVNPFVDRLREIYDGEIMVGDIGAVIGSHSGPRTIGVSFFVP